MPRRKRARRATALARRTDGYISAPAGRNPTRDRAAFAIAGAAAMPSASSRRYLAEWLALLLALALAVALIGFELERRRASVGEGERERLAVQARVIDENISQQLDGINKALLSICAEYAQGPGERPGSSSARLKTLSDAIPGVRNLFMLDATGTVRSSSEPILVGRDFSDRGYFELASRERDTDRLYVSPPLRTLNGQTAIVVERVLLGPTGRFEGAIVAALDGEYFEVVLRSVLYATDMSAALVHADGKVFLTAPHDAAPPDLEGLLGVRSAVQQRPQAGTLLVDLGRGADRRLVAVRAVMPPGLRMDKPLVIVVSRAQDGVFAAWQRQAIEMGGFLAALFGIGSLGLQHSQSRRRELDQLEAAAASERKRGAERLEIALRGAALGLWDWQVPEDRFSHEMARLNLGYGPGEVPAEGGAWRALIHPEDVGRVVATFEAHFHRETEAYECEFRVRHKDGRWVWLLSRGRVVERDAEGRALRMAGTHMDITERKAIELELQRLNERLTQLSTTDGLTEVGNRRLFDQTLNAEWARAARRREPVALLMIDIDHFKDYNDHYGHPAGDECLRRLARLISETVKREGELVARYGGEEFALLLPGADLEAGRVVAQRCLRALADARIEHAASPTSPWVTMSIGVASAVAGVGIKASVLVEAADAALYRAKRAGRGRYES
jgi:diguanylate cyclase (GGDEF)-like protein/PAS domain S-box-containing protein